MSTAKRDSNFVPVGIGVSSVDLVTPLPILVDASTGRLLVEIVATPAGGDVPHAAPDKRDENAKPVMMGKSSLSSTLYMLNCDSNGYLLLDIQYT